MRVLRLAEVGQGVSHNFPVSEYGGAVPLAWHCRADCVRKADEVFFAHRVSPCVCVGVCCVLQRQEQKAQGEDHKNGEDFAQCFKVVHCAAASNFAVSLMSTH